MSLDLAVGCVYLEAGAGKIRVELLRSIDHGATFTHVARPLGPEDAAALDPSFTRFNAANLFFAGGKQYLIASPESEAGYGGCVVVEVADPDQGLLRRGGNGALALVRRIETPTPRFHGACTVAEGAVGVGYLASVGFFNEGRPFRIVRSGAPAP